MFRFNKLYIFLFLTFIAVIFLNVFCNQPAKQDETKGKVYLNLADSVGYVGMNKCKECHADKYNSFTQTGMGMSFDESSKEKSSADYSKPFAIYDKFKDLYYRSYWHSSGSQAICEYRLAGKDTVHSRTDLVSYIIGSGQHTNSHLQNINGYVYQMPMTYYTQKGKWDFPPGFEAGNNTRFERKIGLECMTCHNAYPKFIMGSENKYEFVAGGIDCERCHGPGQAHVNQFMNGERIDTSIYIDYSIVNPAKLPLELQFNICMRCHLQGNSVLKDDKSFFDFKPGMKLSDYWTVFLPKYKNGEKDFIMASHADRLKQSKCYLASLKNVKEGSLKPYKYALTCVTCHDPHVGVKHTGKEVYNSKCVSCHQTFKHKEIAKPADKYNNCVSCHMPKSSSTDIPHVSVTDHYIRTPISNEDQNKVKEFIGLYAVNESNPSAQTKARAYLMQYEKFESRSYYLDSALFFLKKINNGKIDKSNLCDWVNYYFLKSDFISITNTIQKTGQQEVLINYLNKQSYENTHAWATYRIAESYSNLGYQDAALLFYKKATDLAPYILDFENKYGACLLANNKVAEAEKIFQFIIKENPKYAAAYNNLGFIYLNTNRIEKAETLILTAIKLNPDYENALLNYAGILLYKDQKAEATKLLSRIVKQFPGNIKAKELFRSL